jgi:hypothetical protein
MGIFRVQVSTDTGTHHVEVEAADAIEAELHATQEVRQTEPQADAKVLKAARKGVSLRRKK